MSSPRLVQALRAETFETAGHFLSAGYWHSAVVTKAGALLTFGHGGGGRLGHGGTDSQPRPTAVAGLAESGAAVRLVACGGVHTLAVDAEGALHAWGREHFGQLGHGSSEPPFDRHEPAQVPVAMEQRVEHIAAGYWHSLFITTEGECYSCGKGNDGRLGYTCGPEALLTLDGAENFAQRVQRLVVSPALAELSQAGGPRVRSLIAGGAHSGIVLADGTMLSFGVGADGVLGHGLSEASEQVPRP